MRCRCVAVCLLVVLAVVVTVPAADVALVVEIKSLDTLLADADKLASGLDIECGRDIVTGALQDALGLCGLESINAAAPLRAYVLMADAVGAAPAPGAGGPPVVLAVPLKDDGSSFLDAVGEGFGSRAKVGGVYSFTEPVQAKPGGFAALSAAIVGGVACIGDDSTRVETVADLYRAGNADACLAKLPGTVRVGLNVKACAEFVKKQLDMVAAMTAQMPAQTVSPGMTVDTGKILKAEGDALVGIMSQIASLTISIQAASGAVAAYTRVTPVDGTALATILMKDNKVPPRYMSAIPADAMLAYVAGGMDAFDVIAEPYIDLMEDIYGAMGEQMTGVSTAVRKTMVDLIGIYAGGIMAAVVPGPGGKGLGLIEVFELKDVAKAREIMDEMLLSYNEVYGAAMPGLTLKEGAPRTYAGVKIRLFSYEFDPAAAMSDGGGMPPQMMMGMAWMKNMKWQMGFLGNDMIYTMGGGPDLMDNTIDMMLKGAGVSLMESKSFVSLVPSVTHSPVEAYTLSPLKMIKTWLGSLPQTDAASLAMIPDSTGGMAGYSVMMGKRHLISVGRVSYSEINGFKTAGPQIGQLFMGAMMGGMLGGAMTQPPGAINKSCINNLRIIDAAKEQCALEHDMGDGDPITDLPKVTAYIKGDAVPKCPAGGEYALNAIGEDPVCSIPGHELR